MKFSLSKKGTFLITSIHYLQQMIQLIIRLQVNGCFVSKMKIKFDLHGLNLVIKAKMKNNEKFYKSGILKSV